MLELKRIRGRGDRHNERLIIKVIADTDIGDYLVLRTRSESTGPSSGSVYAYWFPDKVVKAGDLVVLYTKTGMDSTRTSKGGSTSHFLYWGAKNNDSLWVDDMAAVLLHAPDWEFQKVESLAKDTESN
jgi:hypothetical protein